MAFVGYPSSTGARQGAAAGGSMIYFDNAATSWLRGTFARLLGLIVLPILVFILQLLIQRFFSQ